ncbi:MAG: hypothetical protein RIK87_29400 [Fuerstiella sp.]
MTDSPAFQEITVLIPGYSIEDLPTDLNEPAASSLLNAFAVAWHPTLLQRSRGIPQVRQAESTEMPTARQIVMVPECSEDWLGHDWKERLEDTLSIAFSGCSDRDDWLAAIAERFGHDESLSPELLPDFFALGTCHLQVMLLSRRMHHFVDPDNYVLEAQAMAAAEAAIAGNTDVARDHLRRCFDCLLECREQFQPVDCCMIDVCLPSDQTTGDELTQLIAETDQLTVICSGAELQRFCDSSPTLPEVLRSAVEQGRLALMTGQQHELRTSLGSLSALYADIREAQSWLHRELPGAPLHWARRRFGMTSGLPTVLSLFDFESALHVALDDGLYPDREHGQLQWQAPDGSIIPAVSRIPMAIDGASSFLRFADRYAESMQEDNTPVLLLARLPVVQTPWLEDLRRAASYAPVPGRLVTMTEFVTHTTGHAAPTQYSEGEYLSPFLIQSSVLKTEAPISSPAALHVHRAQLESIAAVETLSAVLRPNQITESSIDETERRLNAEEASRLSLDTQADAASQSARLAEIAAILQQQQSASAERLARLIPSTEADVNGLCLINPLPWKRRSVVHWPPTRTVPAGSSAVSEAREQDVATRLTVELPAGGFVWLTEALPADPPLSVTRDRGKPLAEELLLRNQFYEVDLSATTGGIASVTFHNQRTNRVSQQVAFRYEHSHTVALNDEEVVTSYATTRRISSRVLESGPVTGTVETLCEITDVVSGDLMARFRQTVTVTRNDPRLQISITFDDIPVPPTGNPWMTYFAARFAWENEGAALTRGMLGQASGFRMERFESPDYIEVADSDTRVVIVPHGRPYHRRSGHRMLDSLLIVEGESERSFDFTLDFDNPFPMRVTSEVLHPVITQPTTGRRPKSADSGWILGLSAKNVILARTRVEPGSGTESSAEPTAVVMLLEETEGRATRCVIRTARPPKSARVRKATGASVQELVVTAEGVTVEFSRFQVREVELTF